MSDNVTPGKGLPFQLKGTVPLGSSIAIGKGEMVLLTNQNGAPQSTIRLTPRVAKGQVGTALDVTENLFWTEQFVVDGDIFDTLSFLSADQPGPLVVPTGGASQWVLTIATAASVVYKRLSTRVVIPWIENPSSFSIGCELSFPAQNTNPGDINPNSGVLDIYSATIKIVTSATVASRTFQLVKVPGASPNGVNSIAPDEVLADVGSVPASTTQVAGGGASTAGSPSKYTPWNSAPIRITVYDFLRITLSNIQAGDTIQAALSCALKLGAPAQ